MNTLIKTKNSVIIVILAIALLLSSLSLSKQIGNNIPVTPNVLLMAANVTPPPPAAADSKLIVYFIDVGQGDSILVICNDKTMLIDGGNTADSDLIYTFLKNHKIKHLNYIVGTHAHEDHIGGLAGALNYASVGTVYCPVVSYNSKAFEDFVKYIKKQGKSITVPNSGDTFSLGDANVKIIAPVNPSDEPNNTSIVMKLTYKNTSFLFTGDCQREEEEDIIKAGYNIRATVLKVGHHGSDTSTNYQFLREIMPKYAVISCGKDNVYGHPHEKTMSKLRDADTKLFRTDIQGTITAKSDGKTITFSTERNSTIQTNTTQKNPLTLNGEAYYIGNINSHKFHRPSCSGLPLKKNSSILDTRKNAIAKGYVPCKLCNP